MIFLSITIKINKRIELIKMFIAEKLRNSSKSLRLMIEYMNMNNPDIAKTIKQTKFFIINKLHRIDAC